MSDETRAAQMEEYRRHFAAAAAALTEAIHTGATDGGEIVSHLLATVAADLGGMHKITVLRPGSWEADYVDRMLQSTVGEDGEYLLEYRTAPIEVVVCVERTLDDLGIGPVYDDSIDLIRRIEGNDGYDSFVDEAAYERVDRAEELIEQLRAEDEAGYRQAFEWQVQHAAERLVDTEHLPATVPVTVRFVDWGDDPEPDWGTVECRLWEAALQGTPPPGFAEPLAQIHHSSGLGDLLRQAGRLPHQRIPELAHYSNQEGGQ